MKLYSDILTMANIASAKPDGCYVRVRAIQNPRVRKQGWKGKLYSMTSNRWENSGTHGAATWSDDRPASWDEYGVWLAALFSLDPNARLGPYNNAADFLRATSNKYPLTAA